MCEMIKGNQIKEGHLQDKGDVFFFSFLSSTLIKAFD